MTAEPRDLVDRATSILSVGARKVAGEVGGPARRRVIILLAAVLGLDAADQGAIGAVAPQLEAALRISNVELGLLVTIAAGMAAVTTLPIGSLVDRCNRVRILTFAILLWGVAQAMSGFAADYPMLLLTRVALGAVTAAAAPAIASLTGDLFPPAERGRIYGLIITGEMLGAGFGVLVSGLVAGWFGWRPALSILAIPSLLLVFLLPRYLPEPARGGKSWIAEHSEVIPSTPEAPHLDGSQAGEDGQSPRDEPLRQAVDESDAEANPDLVVDTTAKLSLWEATRYVLRVRTNVVIVVASSLGYFFFAGLKTFALLFLRGHYGIGQGVATLLVLVVGAGAVAGVILGGRRSDQMIEKGRVTARLDTGVVGYILASVLLVPAIVTSNLGLALPLLVICSAMVAAPNATLDAARLDVVPAKLWGRAEAVRNLLRTVLEASAPLVFGLVSAEFGAPNRGLGAVAGGARAPAVKPSQVVGLEDAFLLMLVLLAVSGVILLIGRRWYPSDIASAIESERLIESGDSHDRADPPARRPEQGNRQRAAEAT